MSEFAFFRFKSANMLTEDEEQDKEEMISLTEQVLDSKGIECDAKISKISEDKLSEILEEVRKLRRKKKKDNIISDDGSSNEEYTDVQTDNEEAMYVR
jgi:hypothetical protein